VLSELPPKQGGFLGIRAIIDAANIWDIVKGFARGMRWLVFGRKRRENDSSYKVSISYNDTSSNAYGGKYGSDMLPIADEFRRSEFQSPERTEGHEIQGGRQNQYWPEGYRLEPLMETEREIMGGELDAISVTQGYVPLGGRYEGASDDSLAIGRQAESDITSNWGYGGRTF